MKYSPVQMDYHNKDKDYYIKDPSVVSMLDGTYLMYATVYSIDDKLAITAFKSSKTTGPWKEIGEVTIAGIEGPQVCAPAVIIDQETDEFTMYIQTAFLEEDSAIMKATSTNGINFTCDPAPILTKNDVLDSKKPVIAVYDVGAAQKTVSYNQKQYSVLAVSGYREVGSGDIYVTLKDIDNGNKWEKLRLAIAQEDVHCHNRPNSLNFEWGLEGSTAPIQLDENIFILIGVCFKKSGKPGTRQRTFWAASDHPLGPYQSMGILFKQLDGGENGHSDVIQFKDHLEFIFQTRKNDISPWYLRHASIAKEELLARIHRKFGKSLDKANHDLRNSFKGHFRHQSVWGDIRL